MPRSARYLLYLASEACLVRYESKECASACLVVCLMTLCARYLSAPLHCRYCSYHGPSNPLAHALHTHRACSLQATCHLY